MLDINDIRSLVTLGGFVLFLGLMVWTWRPDRRAAHEAAARLPFFDEAADAAGAARSPETPSGARP